MNSLYIRRGITPLLVTATLGLSGGLSGCQSSTQETPTDAPLPAPPVLACENPANGDYALLARKALQEKRVSVMVELKMPFTPEGALEAEAREQQRQAIASKQQQVLKVLNDNDQVVAQMATIPFISARVNAKTLARLFCHQEVLDIRASKNYQRK